MSDGRVRFQPGKIEERSAAWLHWLLENELNAFINPRWLLMRRLR